MAYKASLLSNFTFPEQENLISMEVEGRATPEQTAKELVSTHNNFIPIDSQIK